MDYGTLGTVIGSVGAAAAVIMALVVIIGAFEINAGWGLGMLCLPAITVLVLLIMHFRRMRARVFGFIAALMMAVTGFAVHSWDDTVRLSKIEIKEYSIADLEKLEEVPELFQLKRHFRATAESVFEYESRTNEEAEENTSIKRAVIPLLHPNHPYIHYRGVELGSKFKFVLETREYALVKDIPREDFNDGFLAKSKGELDGKAADFFQKNNPETIQVLEVMNPERLKNPDKELVGLPYTIGIALGALFLALVPLPKKKQAPEAGGNGSGPQNPTPYTPGQTGSVDAAKPDDADGSSASKPDTTAPLI